MSIELGLQLGGLIFLLGATIILDTVLVYLFYILWLDKIWEWVHGTKIQLGVMFGYAVMVLGLLIGILAIEAGLFGLL
jgi:hypothetical protein